MAHISKSALTLILIVSACLAASINDKTTRGSKQLFLIPNVTPNWDSLAYGALPGHHTIPVVAESTPHGKLFGLASLLAGASRQCPTCPTCPATTTCPTCATCTTCAAAPALTGTGANTCPTSILTAPNGVVGVSLVNTACTFTISVPAPYTRIRIICPISFSYTGAGAAAAAAQAALQGTIIDVAASPTTTANLAAPPGTVITTTGNTAQLTFPAAGANLIGVFSCAYQGV